MIWAIRDGVDMECERGGVGIAAFWKWQFGFSAPSVPSTVHFATSWTICFTISFAGSNSTSVLTIRFPMTFKSPPHLLQVSLSGMIYSSTSWGRPASISVRTPGFLGVRVYGLTVIFFCSTPSSSASFWTSSKRKSCPSICCVASVDGPNIFYGRAEAPGSYSQSGYFVLQ